MLAHSTRERSRSPHRTSTSTNGTASISTESDRSSPTEFNGHAQNKLKKDNDSQQRLRSLKVKIVKSSSLAMSLFSRSFKT